MTQKSQGGMYGVPLTDPRESGTPLPVYCEAVRETVLASIREHHHPRASSLECGDGEFRIGPPKGKRNEIHHIEVQYRIFGQRGWWRHTFAVTDTAENGLRLWTASRKHHAR